MIKPMTLLTILLFVFIHPGFKSKPIKNESQNKPNILWIIADDLGTDLGCYGTSVVKTPHLDRLAREGILFANCFTVAAVCSPSRSALITGMYPVSINCHQHRTRRKAQLPKGIKPITAYFREKGYFTSNGQAGNRNKAGKQDYNFVADAIFDGTDWSGRKKGQPFFSQIQIHKPHRPFIRNSQNPIHPDSVKLPDYYPDHPVTRKDFALYLENVQLMDKEVGKILRRLEKEALDKNTVVFFFGDQGRPHVRAKQFLYDAGIRTPLIVRWPGHFNQNIVVDDMISSIDIPATSLQLAGIAIPKHMPGISFLPKQNIRRKAVFSMRDRCDETVDRIRSVRNGKFKYIRNFYPERPYTQPNVYKKTSYPALTLMRVMYRQGKLTPEQARFMNSKRPEEELYDIVNDPEELHNLAGKDKYSEDLNRLRNILNRWLVEFDTAIYPEDSARIAFWKKNAAKNYHKKMKRLKLCSDISDENFLKWWEQYLYKK